MTALRPPPAPAPSSARRAPLGAAGTPSPKPAGRLASGPLPALRRTAPALVAALVSRTEARSVNGSAAPPNGGSLSEAARRGAGALTAEAAEASNGAAAGSRPSPPPPPPPMADGSLQAQPEPNTEQILQEEISKQILAAPPSCPLPNFSTTSTRLTLIKPLRQFYTQQADEAGHSSGAASSRPDALDRRPLLVYVPGMDGTGQTVRPQLTGLNDAGWVLKVPAEQTYDIACIYLPSNDRSTWAELVAAAVPLLRTEALIGGSGKQRSVTLLAESFGSCLALRIARAAPDLISRMVLINPATGFKSGNPLISFCAWTGLLAAFPDVFYGTAQDVLLPLMVKRNRVSRTSNKDLLSPVDFVPSACAAWRLAMLNDEAGLEERDLAEIKTPTLLIASCKDRVLPSMAEGTRLQKLLGSARRYLLPESGHTALLEDDIDIANIMKQNGFEVLKSAPEEDGNAEASSSSSTASTVRLVKAEQKMLRKKEAVPDETMDEMGRILEPWRVLTSPLVSGEENLPNPNAQPRRPVLFVGNHTLFGLYDSPTLVYELYLRGFRCRGLAHPGHWLSGASTLLERYGNVKATPRAAYKLLKEGEDVLLFPGGGREVSKRKGEEYKLMWKEKVDFVRMASRFGAIIVPFGALGADDAYKLLIDTDDILESPAGPLIRNIMRRFNLDAEEAVYPITAFPGTSIPSPIPLPTIERMYFHFAKPVDTAQYCCNLNDAKECADLYKLIRSEVENSISYLKEVRARDPERTLPARLLAKARRLLPEFSPR
eukprot:SM000220S07065  [mRNA]  locus=s220:160764:166670:- [translate_table: standard]